MLNRMKRFVRGALTWSTRVLAVVGLVAVLLTVVGIVDDARDFDRTRGGYDPPYTGWTGTPIDWESHDVTDEGFRNPGRVIDTKLNCTTGLIQVDVWGVTFDFRKVSDRAIAVHKPREACEAAGFDAQF
jgi:hypothetical protein